MLHAILDYARRNGLASEPGFAPQDIRWAVSFGESGDYLGIIPLGEARQGRRFASCPTLTDGLMKRARFYAQPLWDTAARFLLFGADQASSADRHRNDLALLTEAGAVFAPCADVATALADPALLERIRSDLAAAGPPTATPNDKVTVLIGDAFPIERTEIHGWWRDRRKRLAEAGGSGVVGETLMRCLATGELVAPVPTHETKIRGLADVGGRGPGDALISFDKSAFQSYGLEQSLNAAVSEEAAKAYADTLNHLIYEHGRTLAGVKIVHWYRDRIAPEDDQLAWLEDPGEAGPDPLVAIQAQRAAGALLRAIETGQRPDLSGNRYFILTLSGAAGRVMVRDWAEGAFLDLVRSIDAWFADLAIVRSDGGVIASQPKFLAVVGALHKQLDDAPAPHVAGLWRAAARNEPVLREAFSRAVSRARSAILNDETPRTAALGLMKTYLLRKPDGSIPMAPFLDANHPVPAYHMGRLLAVFASLQRAALGDVGASVVQRYYIAASQTPALVLGRLVANAKNHLGKLDPGLAWRFDDRVAGIVARLGTSLPKTLDLEGQGIFALGYYQQIAHDRNESKAKRGGEPNE